ncbi:MULTISPECIES: hypothetical protein [unclassified Bradyrhizobium]|uniref:hypothetical protein n=1 Tax=unclassified Bradyrhizobium TaxID=2631580 RepID=UPI002305792D|nr:MULTISPECIES: hypothetical protein [unclassified Bradyrhizobium]MDA9495552.1 hypothetical protein [Bradyrhizobium sp. CCBAU 11361]MDA9542247.1 hypothetical protein [Bradyrhizobium sp. CCBAU 21362]
MVADLALRHAVDAAWTFYRAVHGDVHPADERRCLLERHLQRTWEKREVDVDELTCAGITFLERSTR